MDTINNPRIIEHWPICPKCGQPASSVGELDIECVPCNYVWLREVENEQIPE